MTKSSYEANARRQEARRSNFKRHTVAPLAAVALVVTGVAGAVELKSAHDTVEEQMQVPSWEQPHRLIDIGDTITTKSGKKIIIKSLWDIAANAEIPGADPRATEEMLEKQVPEGQTDTTLQYGDQFILPEEAKIGREVIIE